MLRWMRGIGDERQAMYPWKTRMNKDYAALFIANAKRTARDTIVIHWTDMRAEPYGSITIIAKSSLVCRTS